MTTKYFRVKKDTFLYVAGAILKFEPTLGKNGGYVPIEDIWNIGAMSNEFISAPIIEHADVSEWLERVYPDTIQGKIYRTNPTSPIRAFLKI
jgi:hypothetical protein